MNALRDIWRTLTSLPSFIQGAAMIAVALPLLFAWDGHRIASAEQRGAQGVINAARVDSTLLKLTLDSQRKAYARTDTVRDTVIVRVATVKTVMQRIPDTVRVAYPVVDTLVVASTALAYTVDTLLTRIDIDRAAARMALDVVTAQLTETRMILVGKDDTINTLSKRPTWRTVGTVAVIAPVVWEVGKALVKAVRK